MLRQVGSHWGWIALASVVSLTAVVASRPAFRQKKNQVVIRRPGCRWFGPPEKAQSLAAEDLPFALISVAAYGSANDSSPMYTEYYTYAVPQLVDSGWARWTDFPGRDIHPEMTAFHLRAQVWENDSEGMLVVCFGGTVATNWNDWKANTHWFHSWIRDQYTVVGDTFAPAFAQELVRKRQKQEFLRHVRIIATGHSLGAGLAEKFAYSLPAAEYGIPLVEKVYAFDPSPVTNFSKTSKDVRKENKTGLKIDRIFERGEILAILRSITAVLHKPPSVNPEVRQLRYSLFADDKYGLTNVIANHSIREFAAGLKDVATGN